MTPADDIRGPGFPDTAGPVPESDGKRPAVGPESEVRGGPEAPDTTLDQATPGDEDK